MSATESKVNKDKLVMRMRHSRNAPWSMISRRTERNVPWGWGQSLLERAAKCELICDQQTLAFGVCVWGVAEPGQKRQKQRLLRARRRAQQGKQDMREAQKRRSEQRKQPRL